MLGIILAAVSDAFAEFSASTGKRGVRRGAESLYSFGFLTFFFAAAFFLAEGFLRSDFVFVQESLPTFVPRLFLEVLQAHMMLRAVVLSDRGDFGFVKTLTIPILLGIDLALGYAIGPMQMLGMALVLLPVAALVAIEWRQMRGLGYLLFIAINAVATISLYKYDITHFNSVAAEQSIVCLVLMTYFYILARTIAREEPLALLRKKIFLAQSLASGASTVAGSFAYAFAPASVIVTAMRSFGILFSVLTGRYYFHERHFAIRALLFSFTLAGLVLLAL